MAGGGDNKKIFQYCTDPSGKEILYLSAHQGHSGRNPIDLTLQDNVLIPNSFFEYISHIGCAVSLHSITHSGLIVGGQNSSRDIQTVFFIAVNSMHKNHKDPQELDLTKPRLASYKQKKWNRNQDTVYRVDIQLAQRKGFKFYQTGLNTIIFYDTLPAYCISKAIVMKSEEVITRRYLCHFDHHRKFSTKIIRCAIWILILVEAAKTPNESTQNPKPNYQVRRDPYVEKEEIEERTKFDRDTLNQEKHDEVTDPSSTVRPVCGHESTKRCVLTPKHVDDDQTGTGRPVLVDRKEEQEIDFRVPGLSHTGVKEAEHLRVQELCKKYRKSSSSVSTSCRLAGE